MQEMDFREGPVSRSPTTPEEQTDFEFYCSNMRERFNMDVTLKQLQIFHAISQAERDPEQKLGLLFHSNALAGEVGEMCNIVKKLERERLGIAGSKGDVGTIGPELADIIAYVVLIANVLDINLDAVVRAKFNQVNEELGFKTRL